MNIVRSDNNGDTTVVTMRDMRRELESLADTSDPEVFQVPNTTLLLFAFDGSTRDDQDNEISIVVGELTFTIMDHQIV